MSGNKMMAERMRLTTPHTYTAMQHLVVALADTAKNLGKKTWFGRDKGVESYQKLESKLCNLITAMTLDKVVSASDSSEQILDATGKRLEMFSVAHPNWSDAYQFATYFFGVERESAISLIERLR